MMTKALALLVISFSVVLLSCGPGERSYGYWESAISANVYEFRTASGINCVYVSDGNAGGLSCDHY